jgi:hypothetical protein
MPATSRSAALLWGLSLLSTPMVSVAQDAPPSADSSTEAVAMGNLRVGANQPGATVWIDDKEIGVAPLVRQVPVGEHSVRVSADNFNPFVSKVVVESSGTAAVNAQLFPGGGTVEFNTNAQGGTVTIDGATSVPLPIRLNTVSPGSYRYLLYAPGYEDQEGQFEFARGRNLYIYAELERSAGLFVVDTIPTASVVRLDGVDLGPGPVRREDLAPGPHLVEVEVPGHARMVRAVDTSDGSKLQVTGRVPEKGGTTRIKTGQADAVVQMSGVKVAEGRTYVLDDVARGRYPIEIAAPGYRPVSGRVAVDEGRRAAYKVDWAKEGDRERSQLVEMPPWYARWTTWTIAGGTVAVGVTSAILIARARQPTEVPPADVTLTLP